MEINVSPTGNVLELLNTFVHCVVGVSNFALKLLRINGRQRAIEPALMPK